MVLLGFQEGTQIQALDDHVQGHDVGRRADADPEAVDDRQGERQADAQRGAAPPRGFHLDGAAQLVDVAAHHVHAHAPAREVGDGVGSGEARLEDEVRDLLASLSVRAFGGRGRVRWPWPGSSRVFRPPPSSADLDDDAARFVEGVEGQGARVRLAPGPADFQGFDAVVDGVADDVHQRIAELLHDGLVQLRLGPVDLQLDGLAHLLGDVPHDAAEAVEGLPDLDHAQAQGVVPDLLHQLVDDGGGLQQAGYCGIARPACSRRPRRSPARRPDPPAGPACPPGPSRPSSPGPGAPGTSSACPGPPPPRAKARPAPR